MPYKRPENELGIIQSSSLFGGIAADGLKSVLGCLGAEVKSLRKDEILLLAGDRPRHVGLVLTGLIHIVREDPDGNRLLVAAAAPGELFAEALCCAGVPESPVTVAAGAASTVMLLNFRRILDTCPNSCAHHRQLVENMLRLIAGKNLLLQERMEIVSLKSVRAKVTAYLESFAPKRGREIAVPFNREEMADFLCVERSALSHELARMKKDGLIEYRKNIFVLK